MKLLLENWRKYLNEGVRRIGSREAMEFIITQDPNQIINIDVEIGGSKAFGATNKSHNLPFHYGEYPEFENPADGMPWDLIVVPSASGRVDEDGFLAEHENLLPVGNVSYIEERKDKTGNDKIIIAPNGIATRVDQHIINTFFDKLPQFNKVEWYSASEESPKKPPE